jgi:hypothetical protein
VLLAQGEGEGEEESGNEECCDWWDHDGDGEVDVMRINARE